MGRLRRNHIAAGVALTPEQEEELIHGPAYAVYGDDHDALEPGSSFERAGARREAWEAHRERLVVAEAAHAPGRRPWALWALDLQRPDLATPYERIDVWVVNGP